MIKVNWIKPRPYVKYAKQKKPYSGGTTSNLNSHINTAHPNLAFDVKVQPNILEQFAKVELKAMSKDMAK